MILGCAHCPRHILPEGSLLCRALNATGCRLGRRCHTIIVVDTYIDYIHVPALLSKKVLLNSPVGRLIVSAIFVQFRINLRVGIL